MNNRIIFSKNGTLQDFSVQLNNYQSGSKEFSYVTGEDYLYIGSRLPFNHIYFKMDNPSISDAVMSIDYWDGTLWKNTVEVIDETNGFKQSGHVQFTPSRDCGWCRESTNYAGESVDGLESIVIYDLFWVRISFDASLVGQLTDDEVPVSTAPSIKWCGNLFSDDLELAVEYPDLVRIEVLSSFKTAKTDWQEQHVRAAEVLIQDLIDKQIICEKGQILVWREFINAAIHKTAEIIFNSFGDDYRDNSADARKEYNARLSKRIYKVDTNMNGIEDVKESFNQTGFLSR